MSGIGVEALVPAGADVGTREWKRRRMGLEPKGSGIGQGDAAAQGGDEVRPRDDLGHEEEVRDADADRALEAALGEGAIDAAPAPGPLRDDDVRRRDPRL